MTMGPGDQRQGRVPIILPQGDVEGPNARDDLKKTIFANTQTMAGWLPNPPQQILRLLVKYSREVSFPRAIEWIRQ
jgi:hypothetical protein